MTKIDFYQFINSRGEIISDLNSGSDEWALGLKDAKQAIDILKSLGVPLLGGDVLVKQNGEIKYVYQVWGQNIIP
jgi:hypothetical protein